jgi:hypothetical protein
LLGENKLLKMHFAQIYKAMRFIAPKNRARSSFRYVMPFMNKCTKLRETARAFVAKLPKKSAPEITDNFSKWETADPFYFLQ